MLLLYSFRCTLFPKGRLMVWLCSQLNQYRPPWLCCCWAAALAEHPCPTYAASVRTAERSPVIMMAQTYEPFSRFLHFPRKKSEQFVSASQGRWSGNLFGQHVRSPCKENLTTSSTATSYSYLNNRRRTSSVDVSSQMPV